MIPYKNMRKSNYPFHTSLNMPRLSSSIDTESTSSSQTLNASIDSIKSAAKRAAWKSDSSLDEYNPFNRKRSRDGKLSRNVSREAPNYDEEAAMQTGNGSIPLSKEMNGRNQSDSPTSTDVESQNGAAADYYRGDDYSRASTLNGDTKPPSRTATGMTKRGTLDRVPENEKTTGEQERPIRTPEDLEAERKRRHDEAMKRKIPIMEQVRTVLFPRWITINWLLLAAPVGIALHAVKVEALAVFVVNFIAIIPLAGLLSFATEEVAMRIGEVLGGLLNASFG